MTRLGMRAVLIVVALVTIGCDHVTKHVATSTLAGEPDRSFLADTVRLTYTENTGGFLSLGATLPPATRTMIFVVLTGLALCVMFVLAMRSSGSGLPRFGLALFLAGGLSNWIDRVARGSVVDFMNVGIGPVRTGVFNVADVAIMIGAAIFVLAEIRRARDAGEPAEGTRAHGS